MLTSMNGTGAIGMLPIISCDSMLTCGILEWWLTLTHPLVDPWFLVKIHPLHPILIGLLVSWDLSLWLRRHVMM